MQELELFPAPIAAYSFTVMRSDNGTWRVRAQLAVEGGGFGPPEWYDGLSLGECCDVMCAVVHKI